MKSFGKIIQTTRIEKGLSLDQLSGITKIKKQFLVAIEAEKWEKLPNFPVLQGFVRLIGHALEANEHKLIAFLRRDYPPKAISVNPKPDVSDKIRVSPKLTMVVFAGFLLLLVVFYLSYQFIRFNSPPKLIVDSPQENLTINGNKLVVSGATSIDAIVRVNNQSFFIDANGKFEGEINISSETKEVVVVAISRAGKETVVKRKIDVNKQ